MSELYEDHQPQEANLASQIPADHDQNSAVGDLAERVQVSAEDFRDLSLTEGQSAGQVKSELHPDHELPQSAT